MSNYIQQFKNGETICINSNSVKLQYKLAYDSNIPISLRTSVLYKFNETDSWESIIKYSNWKGTAIDQTIYIPTSTTGKVYLSGLNSTGYIYDLEIIEDNRESNNIQEILNGKEYLININNSNNTYSNYFIDESDLLERGEGYLSIQTKGTGCQALGAYSIAEGYYTIASTDTINKGYSHAEGYYSYAIGVASHVEGQYTCAMGVDSHAEGFFSYALNMSAHAEGENTIAYGLGSHAEGINTITGNPNSGDSDGTHAEGHYSHAIGHYSHAEGENTYTSVNAIASHTEGINTITTNPGEHAQGIYNKSNERTLSSIGIGTSDEDRQNAFEVMQNGNIYIYGIGNYNGANINNAYTIQDIINNENIIAEHIIFKDNLEDLQVRTSKLESLNQQEFIKFLIPLNGIETELPKPIYDESTHNTDHYSDRKTISFFINSNCKFNVNVEYKDNTNHYGQVTLVSIKYNDEEISAYQLSNTVFNETNENNNIISFTFAIKNYDADDNSTNIDTQTIISAMSINDAAIKQTSFHIFKCWNNVAFIN